MSSSWAHVSTSLKSSPLRSTIRYGTCGFRSDAEVIAPIALRVGMVVPLRACAYSHPVVHMGVMVTASHNPHNDNGVKIIDDGGAMMAMQWEAACEQAGAANDEIVFQQLWQRYPPSGNGEVFIHLGRDTRPSGETLIQAIKEGVRCVQPVLPRKISVCDHGVISTPQLHFIVEQCGRDSIPRGMDPIDHYYASTVKAFLSLWNEGVSTTSSTSQRHIIVDCANGVGALALQRWSAELSRQCASRPPLQFYFVSTATDEPTKLNLLCGADYAKTSPTPPVALVKAASELARGGVPIADISMYALDGDADRLVAFSLDSVGTEEDGCRLTLLDGDRLAILFVRLLRQAIPQADMQRWRVGIVQTAYANGASTAYVKNELKLPTALSATGVKSLHHLAEDFDVGVYFEANGHGTALVRPRIRKDQHFLGLFAEVVSQTCGDAIGDLAVAELALALCGMNQQKWKALYTDLPSKQTKIHVPNPHVLKTTKDETRLTSHPSLQDAIDRAIQTHDVQNGRSFLRPSGTEAVVRLYTEASTPAAVHAIEQDIINALKAELS